MHTRHRIIVVNHKLYEHTQLLTDEPDVVESTTLKRALRRVNASGSEDCRFYWNDVQVSLHLVKYNRAELRVKKDGRLLSEYIRQENTT
jgi:hypothetical protein